MYNSLFFLPSEFLRHSHFFLHGLNTTATGLQYLFFRYAMVAWSFSDCRKMRYQISRQHRLVATHFVFYSLYLNNLFPHCLGVHALENFRELREQYVFKLLVISVPCILVYIHVQLDVMSGFHVVQHAQIEKCIPRRFCIKQNNHGSGAVIHVLSSRGELRKWDWTLSHGSGAGPLPLLVGAIVPSLLTGLSGSILHHWVFFCNWTG